MEVSPVVACVPTMVPVRGEPLFWSQENHSVAFPLPLQAPYCVRGCIQEFCAATLQPPEARTSKGSVPPLPSISTLLKSGASALVSFM